MAMLPAKPVRAAAAESYRVNEPRALQHHPERPPNPACAGGGNIVRDAFCCQYSSVSEPLAHSITWRALYTLPAPGTQALKIP